MEPRKIQGGRGHAGLSGGFCRTPRVLIVLIWLYAGFLSPARAESVCLGTTAAGRLEGGVRLPASGENFVAYGAIPVLAGRTYVHSRVRQVVVDSYGILAAQLPDRVFQYGETGFQNGGRFKPHKTHQNGLSVDFMVPVIDKDGKPAVLPTSPFNRYGYDIEFDDTGRWHDYRIDYEAIAAHVLALREAARQRGIGVSRVLFDPQLQPFLYATKHGAALKSRVRFAQKRSWVRHDEHYHVDFSVPCRSL